MLGNLSRRKGLGYEPQGLAPNSPLTNQALSKRQSPIDPI